MSVDIAVVGAHELHALARRLREQGDEGLQKEMRRALDKADKPLENAVRRHVGEYFPNRYARILAKALKASTRIKTTGRDVSVRLVLTAKGKQHLRHIGRYDNPGILRHPVFRRTRRIVRHAKFKKVTYINPWAAQGIRPGFASDQVDELRHATRRDLIHAMHVIAEKVTRG